MLCPTIGPYFHGSGDPISCCGNWSASMHKVHIALQGLQAVVLLLCKMTFYLSGKVVSLHLDNSTDKAYLCNQRGTTSHFLSKLSLHILNLAYKHGITLLPTNIPTHLNVEADCLSQGGWFQIGTCFLT